MKQFPITHVILITLGAFLLFAAFGIKKKKVIFFIGPPTSGKTTAAKWCAKYNGWQHVCTEHLCLDHVKQKTELGKQMEPYVQAGGLVPDSVILPMLEKEILDAFSRTDYVILESFPRTTQQATALAKLLEKKFGSTEFIVLNLHASDETIAQRIQNRFICPNCKKSYILTQNSPLVPQKEMTCDKCGTHLAKKTDDIEQSIDERIAVFRQYEQPLLEFYQKAKTKIASYTITLNKNNPLQNQFQQISNLIA